MNTGDLRTSTIPRLIVRASGISNKEIYQKFADPSEVISELFLSLTGGGG